jgi:hypothetical protein
MLAAAASFLAVLAVTVFGSRLALAYGDAPWCTVTIEGPGIHYECVYNSIAACRSHVVAGNRGSCGENPFYHGPAKRRSAPRHGHQRH